MSGVRVAILTISDAGARGERADSSGDRIAEWTAARGFELAGRALVPDDTVEIVRTLLAWADGGAVDLILTTGGTGLTPRDVTPEATRAVLEREAPGIAEALRVSALDKFPRAALSRGLAGVRGKTLIVNLPGSLGGVADGLTVLGQWIEHAVDLVRGERTEHEQRDQ
jgi:molybdopterin adenylyltransferase